MAYGETPYIGTQNDAVRDRRKILGTRDATLYGILSGISKRNPEPGNFLSGLQTGISGFMEGQDSYLQQQEREAQANYNNVLRAMGLDIARERNEKWGGREPTTQERNWLAWLGITDPAQREAFGRASGFVDPNKPDSWEKREADLKAAGIEITPEIRKRLILGFDPDTGTEKDYQFQAKWARIKALRDAWPTMNQAQRDDAEMEIRFLMPGMMMRNSETVGGNPYGITWNQGSYGPPGAEDTLARMFPGSGFGQKGKGGGGNDTPKMTPEQTVVSNRVKRYIENVRAGKDPKTEWDLVTGSIRRSYPGRQDLLDFATSISGPNPALPPTPGR